MHFGFRRLRGAAASFLSSFLPSVFFHAAAFPEMLPSASHLLFRGGNLFEPHSPLCSKVSPSFLFLTVTLKSFLYLFTPRWLRWKREKERVMGREGGGIIFSHLSEMMTWLLSSDRALSPVFYSPDKWTSLSLHLFFSPSLRSLTCRLAGNCCRWR